VFVTFHDKNEKTDLSHPDVSKLFKVPQPQYVEMPHLVTANICAI